MNKWINLNLIGVGGIPVFGETTCVSLECIYICLQSDGAGWSWQLMFYQKEEFQIVITCSSKNLKFELVGGFQQNPTVD